MKTNKDTSLENTQQMTYKFMCSWADSCSQSYSDKFKFTTADKLITDLEKFLNSECGMEEVEFFNVEFENPNMKDIMPFEWEDSDLKRSQDLTDVWDEETEYLTEYVNNLIAGNGTSE